MKLESVNTKYHFTAIRSIISQHKLISTKGRVGLDQTYHSSQNANNISEHSVFSPQLQRNT